MLTAIDVRRIDRGQLVIKKLYPSSPPLWPVFVSAVSVEPFSVVVWRLSSRQP